MQRPEVLNSAAALAPPDDSPAPGWSKGALGVVGLCFAINMVDGLDVTIMSYIAPALQADWSVGPAIMGSVFSAGLLGMALGGLLIAPLADKLGRRLIIVAALALMAAGMVTSGFVGGIWQLAAARLVVGAGIGTVLAAMAALTAESAPAGRQNLAVGLVQAGYPLMAVGTGFISAWAIHRWGWQDLLLAAGLATTVMVPVALAVLPHGAPQATNREGIKALLAGPLAHRTPWLWVATFCGLMVLYFVVSWIPDLAIAAGLSRTNGIYAGAIYNLGAFGGTLAMSWLATRTPLQRLVPALLFGAALAMVLFAWIKLPLGATLLAVFAIGLTLQGGYNGVWPLAARLYPPQCRATGIGWAMSIGRGGAVIGPLLGGQLMAAKMPLVGLFGCFCVPLLACALAVAMAGQPTAARS